MLLPILSAQSPQELEEQLKVTKGAKRLVLISKLLSAATHTPVENALARAEEALTLLKKFPDPYNEAVIRGYMAEILSKRGRSSEAREHAELAVRRAEESKDPSILGSCLVWLGKVAARSHDFDRATEALERARTVFDLSPDVGGQFRSRNELGNLSRLRGRRLEALEHFFTALDVAEANSNTSMLATVLPNIAFVLVALGQHGEARAQLLAALAANRKLDNQLNVGHILVTLGDVCIKLGEPEAATTKFEEALNVWQALKFPAGVATCQMGLGVARLELDQPEKSLTLLKRAMEL